MHPDLAKLLDAGRINAAVAGRLDQLSPGKFCLHKAWGAGKVVNWDLPSKKVTIDFEQSADQVMDLQFAIQRTEPLDSADFRARKVEELETLRMLAKSDPVGLVIRLLEEHGGTMQVDVLERELTGAVVPASDFRKWWEKTKLALRENGKVVVPSSRKDPLKLTTPEEEGVDTSESFSLFIEPGDSRPDTIADFLFALSELHRAHGGEGIEFRPDGFYIQCSEEVTA